MSYKRAIRPHWEDITIGDEFVHTNNRIYEVVAFKGTFASCYSKPSRNDPRDIGLLSLPDIHDKINEYTRQVLNLPRMGTAADFKDGIFSGVDLAVEGSDKSVWMCHNGKTIQITHICPELEK